jgi:hypothetical protein
MKKHTDLLITAAMWANNISNPNVNVEVINKGEHNKKKKKKLKKIAKNSKRKNRKKC